MTRTSIQFTIIVLSAFLSSCSVSKLAFKNISSTLSNTESTVFTGDDDPELIKEALPFTMKLYESLLQKDSTNADLLLATSKLFTLYAQAYLILPADTLSDSNAEEQKHLRKRAKKLLLRGRDYALRGLDQKHPVIYAKIKGGNIDSALSITTIADTSFLYWSAVPWMAAVTADRSDLGLSMTIKKAYSMLNKVIELNETFSSGAAHEILAAYLASVPKALGGDEQSAREHFNKALELSQNTKVSPFVTMASTVSLKSKNKEEYTSLLQKATSVNVQAVPAFRLQNIIYQQYARFLQSRINQYFPETDSVIDE